jgi:hypothetical protein
VGLRAGLDRCGISRPHRDSISGPSIVLIILSLNSIDLTHVITCTEALIFSIKILSAVTCQYLVTASFCASLQRCAAFAVLFECYQGENKE